MQNVYLTEKSGTLKNIKNLLSYIALGKEILRFGDIAIEKNKFYCNKIPVFLKDEDIEKVLVSNKTSFGEKSYKYFIGFFYNDDKVKLLNIMLPKQARL